MDRISFEIFFSQPDYILSSDRGESVVSKKISYLEPYTFSMNNQEREIHLRELCRRGIELWRMMDSHPSRWAFGQFVETKKGQVSGPVMVFPPLLKDGERVANGQTIWP